MLPITHTIQQQHIHFTYVCMYESSMQKNGFLYSSSSNVRVRVLSCASWSTRSYVVLVVYMYLSMKYEDGVQRVQ